MPGDCDSHAADICNREPGAACCPCFTCLLPPLHFLAVQLCFFTVHWGACGFWYIARQGGFSPQTWVGANLDWVDTGHNSFDK
jgi:hypothetical protein